jgi:hypothetical protein
MIRSANVVKKSVRGAATPDEDAGPLDRSFRCAVIIYAVVEFFAVALVLYYKLAR